jgi:integrase
LSKQHLTLAAVARLRPPATGQADHYDIAYPGLALRLSSGGKRVWTLVYSQQGKVRRATLGAALKGTEPALEPGALGLVEAREAWRKARERLRQGLEPIPEAPSPSPTETATTVRAVVADWLAKDQKHNRKYRTLARGYGEVHRIMYREVIPLWGARQIADITPDDVDKLIDAIKDRGKVTQACRVYARLHRFFKWAMQRRIIAASPMSMPKPAADVGRKRVLNDRELAAAWSAAQQNGWPLGTAIQLLILTCARRTEIGALRWAEIDTETNEIRLNADRTKNGQPHIIPLSAMAREILDTVPRVAGSPFVFSTTTTTAISGWSNVKERIDATMRAELGGDVERWTIHDLRRTAATGLEKLGIPLAVTEALLAHTAGSKAGIAGIYQRHDYREEKREAVEQWAKHVASLVGR